MEPSWTNIALEELLESAPRPRTAIQGVRIGTLISADVATGVRVVYEEQPMDEAVEARTTVSVSPDDEGRSVLLVFEGGNPTRPIITGFIQEQPVSQPATMTLTREAVDEVQVDQARVCLEARQEIVLRCGRSSITLRADGKIVIKGREIVSRAASANKIKGSTVRIN